MAIARRSAARYADAAHLAALGLNETALRGLTGFFGTVTQTGSGTGTVTPSGSPAGVYDVRVRVSTGGALGAAAVEISLDAGETYRAPVTVPSGGVLAVSETSSSIATGLVLTFAGAFVLADVYAFDAASKVEMALDAASDWLDGYLAKQFTLPLLTWGADVSGAAAAHAALTILTARGYDPAQGSDVAIRESRDDAQRWAELVARGAVIPTATDSAAEEEGIAVDVHVSSRGRRGWR